jgi:chromosome segregation ATPase
LDQLNLDLEKDLRVRSIAGPSIDARLDRLKNRKNNLVKQKKLTSQQEAEINTRIQKIEKDYVAFKASDKKLDPKEVLNLALELDKIGTRLSELAPGEVSSAIKSIDSLQTEIRTMLDGSNTKANFSIQQLDEYKQENSRIETLESLFKADNSFTDSEVLTVVRELESLKEHMVASSKNTKNKPDLSTKIEMLRKRVKEVNEAKRFKQGMTAQEMDKGLDSIEKKLKIFNKDNELSDSEVLVLSSELDSLNSKLESSLQNLPDVQERKLEIERRLNEALASNRVAIKKAEDLRREGSRISFLETRLKRDGILSDVDIVQLSQQYDNLEKKLAELLPPLPDIDKLQNQVTTKLENAKAKGTIPKAKLDYFSDEMDRINSIGSSFKASDDRLSDWEIMALKSDLENLEKDIDKLSKPDQVKKQ